MLSIKQLIVQIYQIFFNAALLKFENKNVASFLQYYC